MVSPSKKDGVKKAQSKDTGQSVAAGSCLAGGLHRAAWPGCSRCPPYSEAQKKRREHSNRVIPTATAPPPTITFAFSSGCTPTTTHTRRTCWLEWEEGDKRCEDSGSGGDGVGIISHPELIRHWKERLTFCVRPFSSHTRPMDKHAHTHAHAYSLYSWMWLNKWQVCSGTQVLMIYCV